MNVHVRPGLALLALALTATACTSSGSGGGSSTPGSQASALRAELPPAIRKAGVVSFITGQHPPYVVMQGNTMTGPNRELQDALAGQLGVKDRIDVGDGSLAPILTGLLSKKYDAFMGPDGTTKAREAQFDSVSWINSRNGFLYAKHAVSASITAADPSPLCGKAIAVVTGSQLVNNINSLGTFCRSKDKPAPSTIPLTNTSSLILAITSGRAAAAATTDGAMSVAIKQQPSLASLFPPDDRGGSVQLSSMLMLRGSGLAPVMLKAMKALFDDGTYSKILAKYGLQRDAITAPQLNPSVAS